MRSVGKFFFWLERAAFLANALCSLAVVHERCASSSQQRARGRCGVGGELKGGFSVGIKLFCHSRGPQVVRPKHWKMSYVTWKDALHIFISRRLTAAALHWRSSCFHHTIAFSGVQVLLTILSLELVHYDRRSDGSTRQSQRLFVTRGAWGSALCAASLVILGSAHTEVKDHPWFVRAIVLTKLT